ncbi:thiolase domain-containing protein [Microbacterium enclense]|uniref:thiolase C-terminal domain-containing protein n=1 Tax=Microbacterium enclense TaxID=993073 RepID=UPI0021A3AA5A|nr:thiolase domain-containing protein [Microbacterium enclense]MCT2085131.1 thiolase domain-containing protein [Microbacterium enclense]
MSVVIIGAAETNRLGKLPEYSTMALHVEAAVNALQDAGLTLADIDGIASVTPLGPLEVADALGIAPRWVDSTSVGGSSFLYHVRHAAAAIAAGHCSTVLITHGESGRSRTGEPDWHYDPSNALGQFELPHGAVDPVTSFPLPLLRYMKETGLTPEQLAMVPVVQRQWAALNPRAYMRDPITVDDVLSSRLVTYPLHLLECCLVTDGGGALILTSSERARDMNLRTPPVHVLGTGEAVDSPLISQMPDLTSSRGFRDSSAAAFREAGISHADVDHIMIYDAFAHLPIYGLEDMGFLGRGEAAAFIADGNTAPGGSLPVNTNGGGLSYTHTGMYGMFAIQEAVRQLRREAAAQVNDVDISVVLGNGGMFMSASTLVLGTAAAADSLRPS